MPSSATAKTASARSRLASGAIVAVAGIVVAVSVLLGNGLRHVALHVSGHTFLLTVADTETSRQRGLGGVSGLPPDRGMLFVFQTPANQCFWMKDTHFALDMIWLDRDQRVVMIRPDVTPATYPDTFCAPNAEYVIELNAGAAARAQIHPGQTLMF